MMEIRQNLTNVNYTPRGTAPTWIVVHNTANGTSADGTAWANTNYFKSTYRSASAHYFVDDGDVVWQCVKDTDTAWHVGEAASRNGATNYNAIGVEVCERADGSFSEHEIEVLQWLVPMLMAKWGIDASHVCRHYDVTGKTCPWGYVDKSAWERLKQCILEGEDMATPGELWGYNWENTAPGGNMYNCAVATYKTVEAMERKIDSLNAKLDKVAAGNIDYAKLAKAVNDDAAKRMQS